MFEILNLRLCMDAARVQMVDNLLVIDRPATETVACHPANVPSDHPFGGFDNEFLLGLLDCSRSALRVLQFAVRYSNQRFNSDSFILFIR